MNAYQEKNADIGHKFCAKVVTAEVRGLGLVVIMRQSGKKLNHGTGEHMSRSNFNAFIYGRQVNKGSKLAMCGSKKKRKRIKRGK